MKKLGFCVLALFSTSVLAAADEAALKEQMHKACAPLFAAGGACADLAKGTRKCTRQNVDKGGPSCVEFEKGHKEFFDAGMNDPTIRK